MHDTLISLRGWGHFLPWCLGALVPSAVFNPRAQNLDQGASPPHRLELTPTFKVHYIPCPTSSLLLLFLSLRSKL
jgi:hypothetical protein